ncbi:extensin family protein [Afifella sp. JA880]|uniref:extensin family protein n=1 Tax=Afifella sp. JA880 TaxID=2975280 RepID=UPI0021BB3905|nr:extensin family protein [Afifella sp. JA880]MCT8268896.1 extensin family protein [Afifella sp. JA880]
MTSHLPVWGFALMLALSVGTAGAQTPPLKPQPRPAEAADAEGTAAAAQPSASPFSAGKPDGAPAAPKPRPEGSGEDVGAAPPVPDIRPQGEAERADEGSASPATEDAPEPENEDGPAPPSPDDTQADQPPKDEDASQAEPATDGEDEAPADETSEKPAGEAAGSDAPSLPEARPEDAPKPVEPLIAQPPSETPSEGPDEHPAAPEDESSEEASKVPEEDEAAKAAAAEEFRQCVWRLRALGVEFDEEPAITDGGACEIAHPIEVEELAPGVAISPPVTLNCAATEALATWLKEVVKPAAKELLDGAELRGVIQASGYVCRTRYNRPGAKISEHALANAIDVSAITFKSRSPVSVKEREDADAAASRFQKRIREGACKYFTTVLGPGANAAHATHFHFDLKARSNGYRICQ